MRIKEGQVFVCELRFFLFIIGVYVSFFQTLRSKRLKFHQVHVIFGDFSILQLLDHLT